MVEVCQEVLPQMVHQSASEGVEVSVISTPMLEDTGLLLLTVLLLDRIAMVVEVIVIGNDLRFRVVCSCCKDESLFVVVCQCSIVITEVAFTIIIIVGYVQFF